MIAEHTGNQTSVITGGADGRLAIIDLNMLQQHNVCTPSFSSSNDLVSAETLRSFCWLSSSKLLAVSATGYISLGMMKFEDYKSGLRWFPITHLVELSEHVLLHRVDSDCALITGSFGHVYLFSAEEMKVHSALIC